MYGFDLHISIVLLVATQVTQITNLLILASDELDVKSLV